MTKIIFCLLRAQAWGTGRKLGILMREGHSGDGTGVGTLDT